MMRCDGGVTDDNNVSAGKHAIRDVHDAVKQPAADSDVVASRAKTDSQGLMMVHNNPELCFREMAVKGIQHDVYRRSSRQAVRLHRDMGAAIVGLTPLGEFAKRL